MNNKVDPPLSGIMHCWLAVAAEVGGDTYICVRGVNFLNEYRSGMRSSEKGNRMHQKERPPWLHVPTVTFPYDVKDLEGTVSPSAAENQVTQKIQQQWSGLAAASLTVVDQNFTSSWGATNAAGETEAVTRLFLDFGKVVKLPTVLLSPNTRPPYPRHPVFWVKAKDIIWAGAENCGFKHGPYPSRYKLIKPYSIQMELDAKGNLEEKRVRGYLFQETVGDIFRKVRGNALFSRLRRSTKDCSPT
ncbi:MAG: hypothetical protein PHD48_05325 [Alphaproteobacteria bacterium]|nr:hypothetical protein [Alphaproteobacteria bacterium]